ncbi:TonB-dependent receptor [Azoarcus sp. L1K30]|uniref:TonB-dependent receptor domain-containing protein n=1 Tax=Azoarcus sp. L1K30 TaxID=2820277 RepID=UPI001B831B41|nr:TonB-dependent receptor [Azoarcus sp. L1K30]MBR0565024.1 TonB-dependent receptor [Azoarcus sp. L1K30]
MPIRLKSVSLAMLAAIMFPCRFSVAEESGRTSVQAPEAEKQLSAVVVSSSALALSEATMSTPVTVLTGIDLLTRSVATLGETLEGTPGMTSTHFGAGASRPIIRGMDGARVKVLVDGSEIMDASTISPDHAVAVEPMSASQIEVLRGPSALAYGGGAIGGVVNILDDRIPTAMPRNGLEGRIDLQADTAANQTAMGVGVTAGGRNVAIHAEGLTRDASDYRVGNGWTSGSRVEGAYNQTQSGSLGVSWVADRGYLGLAYSSQRNEYGLPGHSHELEACHTHGDHLHCGSHDGDDGHAHEGVADEGVPYVRLESDRWDLRGEYLAPIAGIASVRMRANLTDYAHDELEDGEVATRFRNKAHDARLELTHEPFGGLKGVVGVQSSERDFSALGEEAYIQPTLTRRRAIFLIEEHTSGPWRFEAGLRREWQTVETDTSADRREDGMSASLGTVWRFAPQYALGLTFSRAQRLPTAEELYADGLHAATRTIERGNASLEPETSRNIDLTLKKLEGDTTFTLGVFRNRISDYIHAHTLDAIDDVQLIEYAQRDATFAGVEGEIRQRVNRVLGVAVFGDYVRARLAAGEGDRDLARIPAHRVGVRVDGRWQGWGGELEWYRVGRQNDIAAFEAATPGYNMLNLSANYSFRSGEIAYAFYVRASNLGDVLAYSHTSFIKDMAPLTGRNLTIGVRASF